MKGYCTGNRPAERTGIVLLLEHEERHPDVSGVAVAARCGAASFELAFELKSHGEMVSGKVKRGKGSRATEDTTSGAASGFGVALRAVARGSWGRTDAMGQLRKPQFSIATKN